MAAAGVDIVASVGGIISVSLTAAKGCFELFELLEKAQNLGSDAEVMRWKLEYEHYRLYRWYKQIWQDDERPPNRKLNWNLIKTMLQRLRDLLERSQSMRERYNIPPGDTKVSVEGANDSPALAPT